MQSYVYIRKKGRGGSFHIKAIVDRRRDWSDVAPSKELITCWNTANKDSPRETLEGVWPCSYFDLSKEKMILDY